ncbi:hypothetical protein DFJ74DRAFT_683849 [Hyaloraphidium curvatum]|nr:hypothetical protein DFJ74DRAFT_683849 [Hyaloraphidium curvatum]
MGRPGLGDFQHPIGLGRTGQARIRAQGGPDRRRRRFCGRAQAVAGVPLQERPRPAWDPRRIVLGSLPRPRACGRGAPLPFLHLVHARLAPPGRQRAGDPRLRLRGWPLHPGVRKQLARLRQRDRLLRRRPGDPAAHGRLRPGPRARRLLRVGYQRRQRRGVDGVGRRGGARGVGGGGGGSAGRGEEPVRREGVGADGRGGAVRRGAVRVGKSRGGTFFETICRQR